MRARRLLGLRCERARLQRCTVPDLPFTVEGPVSAPTVVLVHGAPDRSAAFNVVLAELDRDAASASCATTAEGTGARWRRAGGSLADHADDLLAVIDHVGRPCVVVAHSFGSNPEHARRRQPPRRVRLARRVGTPDGVARVVAPDHEGLRRRGGRRSRPRTGGRGLQSSGARRRRVGGPRSRRSRSCAGPRGGPSARTWPPSPARRSTRPTSRYPSSSGTASQTATEHVRGAHDLVADAPNAALFCIEGAGHFANRTHPGDFARFVEATIALAASTRTDPTPRSGGP